MPRTPCPGGGGEKLGVGEGVGKHAARTVLHLRVHVRDEPRNGREDLVEEGQYAAAGALHDVEQRLGRQCGDGTSVCV